MRAVLHQGRYAQIAHTNRQDTKRPLLIPLRLQAPAVTYPQETNTVMRLAPSKLQNKWELWKRLRSLNQNPQSQFKKCQEESTPKELLICRSPRLDPLYPPGSLCEVLTSQVLDSYNSYKPTLVKGKNLGRQVQSRVTSDLQVQRPSSKPEKTKT